MQQARAWSHRCYNQDGSEWSMAGLVMQDIQPCCVLELCEQSCFVKQGCAAAAGVSSLICKGVAYSAHNDHVLTANYYKSSCVCVDTAQHCCQAEGAVYAMKNALGSSVEFTNLLGKCMPCWDAAQQVSLAFMELCVALRMSCSIASTCEMCQSSNTLSEPYF